MVKSILENAGYKVGLIGTIEAIIGEKHIPAANTTPESYMVQKYFHDMVEAGCDAVVMEVSSQGLMLHRTQGFIFDFGIFTNIEPDHIGPNEHKDFDDYLHCKSMLLKQCKVGIVNRDDEHFEKIIEGHTCELETYGFSEKADLCAEDAKLIGRKGYLGISYHVKGLLDFPVEIDIPGKFSIYNSLTAIAICRHFRVSEENIIKALKVARVKGRIEMIKVSDEFTLMIDYAHNAMALESLLGTLKEYNLTDWYACSAAEETVPNFVVMKWARFPEKWQTLPLLLLITREMRSRRLLSTILKWEWPRQMVNSWRSRIVKRRSPMRSIMVSREISLSWQEKDTKIIRRSRAKNIRWMSAC